MQSVITKITILFILTIIFLTIPYCSKDDRIPYVHVNHHLNLSNPEFNNLIIPGNYEYLENIGVKGVIIYCAYAGHYNAYERNCPYKPYSEGAFLRVDSTETFMVCKSCDSKFLLFDGSIVEGPSKYPVLQYETLVEYEVLYIYNHYY